LRGFAAGAALAERVIAAATAGTRRCSADFMELGSGFSKGIQQAARSGDKTGSEGLEIPGRGCGSFVPRRP